MSDSRFSGECQKCGRRVFAMSMNPVVPGIRWDSDDLDHDVIVSKDPSSGWVLAPEIVCRYQSSDEDESGADEIREMIALLKRIEHNTAETLKVQQAIFELLLSRKPT